MGDTWAGVLFGDERFRTPEPAAPMWGGEAVRCCRVVASASRTPASSAPFLCVQAEAEICLHSCWPLQSWGYGFAKILRAVTALCAPPVCPQALCSGLLLSGCPSLNVFRTMLEPLPWKALPLASRVMRGGENSQGRRMDRG